MRKLKADSIFTPDCQLVSDLVLILDGNNRVEALVPSSKAGTDGIEVYEGLLCPGFVNTHCHLELSHMKDKIDTGTGLLPFIESVVKTRGASHDEILDAIARAEDEMFADGIVAVGDISNQVDTFPQKSKGRIRYYTFIECFDFMQEEKAQETYEQYRAVYDQLECPAGSRKSFVPHAPYSVSDSLYRMIRESNSEDATISIHNQETPPEDELFISGTGGFVDFYSSFGISLGDFKPTGRPSIHSALPHLNPANRNLFVHNTLTNREDISAAHAFSRNVYWATCPNANLYIENRLPRYSFFMEENARVTIGTDSLTSNWRLSILDEMRTISKYQSYVPLETLLTWATINGAMALGFDYDLGSFEKGKSPGVVLVSQLENGRIGKQTTSRRLA